MLGTRAARRFSFALRASLRYIHNVSMSVSLASVVETLQEHQAELRKLGVVHASVFGSVARGESRPESDVDVLIDLDPAKPIGVFQYARIRLYINELLGGAGDVVNRRKLKPLLRENILRESVSAF